MLPVHSVLDGLRTQLSAILRDERRASLTLVSMQEAHLLQTFHELTKLWFQAISQSPTGRYKISIQLWAQSTPPP